MTPLWLPFAIAALIGAAASALAQAGTQPPSRMADLIAAFVAGCFFGTFAFFFGRWVLLGEAVFGVLWVFWAHAQQHRPRANHPE